MVSGSPLGVGTYDDPGAVALLTRTDDVLGGKPDPAGWRPIGEVVREAWEGLQRMAAVAPAPFDRDTLGRMLHEEITAECDAPPDPWDSGHEEIRENFRRVAERLWSRFAALAAAPSAPAPRRAVGVLVRRGMLDSEEPELLLGNRIGADGGGTWCTPGGWIEPGETPLDAAVRELAEETGIEVEPERMREIPLRTVAPADGDLSEVELCWFVVEVPESTEAVVREPEKCATWKWIGPDPSGLLGLPVPISRGTGSLVDVVGVPSLWTRWGTR